MSGDVLMKVNANAPDFRFSRGFVPAGLTGSLASEVLGLIDDIAAQEAPPVLRTGGQQTAASASAFGFSSFDGNACWTTNGNCFRLPESIGSADRRSTNGTHRLTSLDASVRRLPVANNDGLDVRQMSFSSSSAGGNRSSRGDVMSDSCYFSSSLSSSLSSTSSSSSSDGLAATSGGTSNDQPMTSASGTIGSLGAYSWMQGGGEPSPPPTSSGQSHHPSVTSIHHGDDDGGDVERMQLNAAAIRPSANMTECVTVPSSEHVAEIVGRQGCKIKALRNKTNTYIKTPARGEEPVFVITGRREDVSTARQEILTAADHFSQIRASRRATAVNGAQTSTPVLATPLPPSPALTSSPMSGSPTSGLPPPVSMPSFDRSHVVANPTNPASSPGQTTCEVRVPVRVVGLVVGPKGATVKRIQAETGTYIVTPSRGTDPVFEIIGCPENVERARREIESYVVSHGGSGGGVRTGPSSTSSTAVTTTTGNGLIASRCMMRTAPMTDARQHIGSVSSSNWRQLLSDNNGVSEGNSSSSAEETSPTHERLDYGYTGLHNHFKARLHLDDADAEATMSKSTGIVDTSNLTNFHLQAARGLDDFGTHMLLLQAAAEANSATAIDAQRHQMFDTAYDVIAAAEQLIGSGVTSSGCVPSSFDSLPASSTWSGVPTGMQQLTSEASKLFDVWGSSNHKPMPSAVFRQHPGGFTPEGLSSWFSGRAEMLSSSSSSSSSSNNAGSRMNCSDDVIANRWIETQSASHAAIESAMLESPMTPRISPSAVSLF